MKRKRVILTVRPLTCGVAVGGGVYRIPDDKKPVRRNVGVHPSTEKLLYLEPGTYTYSFDVKSGSEEFVVAATMDDIQIGSRKGNPDESDTGYRLRFKVK